MRFVNCTPHTLTVFGIGDLPPSGICPRVQSSRTLMPSIDGVRIVKQTLTDVLDMPPPEQGVIYIVSSYVLNALTDRPDVFAPDTGADAIRSKGQIVAVRGLVGN